MGRFPSTALRCAPNVGNFSPRRQRHDERKRGKTDPCSGLGAVGLVSRVPDGDQHGRSSATHHPLRADTTLLAVANGLAMIVAVWLGAVICNLPWQQLMTFGPLRWRLVPAVILMGLGMTRCFRLTLTTIS